MADSKSSDQFFIDRLTKIVIANLSKESFDVGELAKEAHMSRSAIHRRLKRLTNQNASQFIREIRLHKALEMLQIDLSTVAEVAYKVGFGSPTYFTKCFHEYYGYPPGEARKKMPITTGMLIPIIPFITGQVLLHWSRAKVRMDRKLS